MAIDKRRCSKTNSFVVMLSTPGTGKNPSMTDHSGLLWFAKFQLATSLSLTSSQLNTIMVAMATSGYSCIPIYPCRPPGTLCYYQHLVFPPSTTSSVSLLAHKRCLVHTWCKPPLAPSLIGSISITTLLSSSKSFY